MISWLFEPLDTPFIAGLMEAIEAGCPLSHRQKAKLPQDIRHLALLLTAGRADRVAGYLGKPVLLSAYLRYYLPWNVYRLCRLIPSLDLELKAGDAVLDLGSGPLTFPIALWLARPDLRNLALEIRCLDRQAKVLEAGRRVFDCLRAASPGPQTWRIKLIQASLGAKIEGKKAALLSAVNLLNELHRPSQSSLGDYAFKLARQFDAICADNGQLLLVEPGTPPSAELLVGLRTAFIRLGRQPFAPCPQVGPCPMPGTPGQKWCHFAFDSEGVPTSLQNLSAAAGLAKERAVLSFLALGPRQLKAAGKLKAAPEPQPAIRVISDAFPLPNGYFGRYACSAAGLILIRGQLGAIAAYPSGSLLSCPIGRESGQRDAKSGAKIVIV